MKNDDPSPRLSWILTFVCVARYGGFGHAARYLGIPQPVASRRIKALEGWLGHQLFERSRPPVLTSHGRTLLPLAKTMISGLYLLQHGRHFPVPPDPTPSEIDKAKALWAMTETV